MPDKSRPLKFDRDLSLFSSLFHALFITSYGNLRLSFGPTPVIGVFGFNLKPRESNLGIFSP
jgi:hypothetical protein